jgi:hypothetical protein
MKNIHDILYYFDVGQMLDCMKPAPVFPDEDWLQDVSGKRICSECKCILRNKYPEPLHVVLRTEPEGQTSFQLETTNIIIWRRDFIEYILKYLPDFILGDCFLPDGSILKDYVTCYASKCIVVRGGKQSTYHICSSCGAIFSDVEPGPKYVLKNQLSEAKIYQDAYGHLFIMGDIVWNFDFLHWEDVSRQGLSVRELPADGQILPGNSMSIYSDKD